MLRSCVHLGDWAVIAYISEYCESVPQWRVAYPEPLDLPEPREATMAREYERVALFLKGSKEFKVARAEPYLLHQQCASQVRKDRMLLGGDALHLNPIGGLGLTTGILDAFAYGHVFVRVLTGEEPDSLIAACAKSRREAFINATNSTSIANLSGFSPFPRKISRVERLSSRI